jgi:hypothetical protein
MVRAPLRWSPPPPLARALTPRPASPSLQACKRGDEEAEQEQWVMVGGSSQPRRHQQQQPTAHHQQPGAADGIATAAQCSSSLPGWGASGGGFTYSSSGSRRKHKDRQATLSPQQAAEQLARRVGDIAGELRQSAVFAALTAAMQQAAGACSEQQQEGTSSTTNSSSSSSWDWSAVQQLVVYGLGSPMDSKVSQHQVRHARRSVSAPRSSRALSPPH